MTQGHSIASSTSGRARSAQASVGGIGGGTGLVGVAHLVGPSTPFGAILLYAAPAATVIVGSLLYYVEIQVSRYAERRVAKNARKTLEAALANPLTSDEHRARIRAKLEALEEVLTTREVERVTLIGLPPPPIDSAATPE